MDFNIATAFWFAARGKGRLLGSKEVEDVQRELNRVYRQQSFSNVFTAATVTFC
jgi:hypothetical protein